MEHELENVPLARIKPEQERREKALQEFRTYKEALSQDPDAEFPEFDIRIWWTDPETQQGEWVSRLYVPAGEILLWKAEGKSDEELQEIHKTGPNADFRTPGKKVLEKDRAYLRLLPGLGLCVFSGEKDIPPNTILTMYAGWLCNEDSLSAHRNEPSKGWILSLRHRASMPGTVSAINGGPVQQRGDRFDLRYFWQNGFGSLLNTVRKTKCNCKFVVEYADQKYYERAPKLFLDDEYCPQDVPYGQRVLPLKHFFICHSLLLPILSTKSRYTMLWLYLFLMPGIACLNLR